jgi:predicted DNA-binding transcriptional regulator AlpA
VASIPLAKEVVVSRLTMTIEEFAQMTGTSRNLCYTLARQDKLPVPVIFIGKRRMVVSRQAVEELIAPRAPREPAGKV